MINILYSDSDLAVAVKPAGILSQGDEKGGVNMLSRLKEELESDIFPIHRLDRETAGVMVFAKNAASAAKLSEALREKRFSKEYLALLTAKPQEEEGIFEDLLFFDRGKNKVFPVKRQRRGVKKARLTFRLEKEAEGLFLVRVFPETGRTHQIRVQFASRRMPLYGDRKYGGKGDSLGLFCTSLSFPHPKSGRTMHFSALPEKISPWGKFLPL